MPGGGWLPSPIVQLPTFRSARLLGAAACVAALGLTAACGGTSTPPASSAPAPAPAAAIDAAAGQGGHSMPGMGSGGLELYAVQTGSLGVVVTDGQGRLVYGSDQDMTDPPMSMCTGACTQEWQPLVVPAGQQPDLLGVDTDQVGLIARPDGGGQVTLGGWPVYVNAHDDGTHNAVAPSAHGTWFVMTPQGERVPV